MAETMDQFAVAVGKTFVWHEVYGPSADASIDFYTKALGWGVQSMEMGEMGTYHMLTVNGTAVAGIQATDGNPQMEGVPPHWATYVAVDDVDARVAKCESLGATVLVPAMDIPKVGRMCLIKDPQGATVWLFTPDPQQG
jgi:uncharacterized protein